MVHDHLYDACCLLYQKVYQAAPSNGELMTKFARGFVFGNCVAAKADLKSHKIAWAVMGGMVLDNVKAQRGGLNRKVSKFMSNYGVSILHGQTVHVADSCTITLSNHPAKPSEVASRPLYIEGVDIIAKDLDGKIHIAEAKVDSTKMVLVEKKDLWLRNKGSYCTFAPVIKEMERLKAKIDHISPQGNEYLILKKETKIAVLGRVVSMAGAMTNAKQTKEEVITMQVHSKLEHLLLLLHYYQG